MATWRVIENFPDYAVSDCGSVRRIAADCRNRPGRVLKQSPAPNGYMTVQLFLNRKGLTQRVHRLVCVAFHGPAPFESAQVAHIDGDQKNNRADNLRWSTAKENSSDKDLHGTRAVGARHGLAKVTEDVVRLIRATPRLPRATGSNRALARRFNLDRSTVGDIRSLKTWRHVR